MLGSRGAKVVAAASEQRDPGFSLGDLDAPAVDLDLMQHAGPVGGLAAGMG
jgi:hypothetical protein